LELSIQEGVTGTAETRRGLGLYILSEFVRSNEGELSIISGNGLLSVRSNALSCKKLNNSFPGTAINIELLRNNDFNFNIDDRLDEAEMIF
jgi:hypothetical protein